MSRSRPRRGLHRLGVAVVALMLAATPAASQSVISEYEVKAAFLFHFAEYVHWPEHVFPDAKPSLELCVLGKDPFGPLLDKTIGGKSVLGRPLVIRRLTTIDAAAECQILFVSASETKGMPEIIRAVTGASVLTVSETEGFARRGGIINFRVENDNVRFEINPDAAQRSDLKISAQLLKLATVVHGDEATTP
jgi:hypothetical protein